MKYTITKVKAKDGDILIRYTKESSTGAIESHELECSEEPRPMFNVSLQVLAYNVVGILELPEDYIKDLTVIGVTFSSNTDGETYMITALKKVAASASPFVVNTPMVVPSPNERTALDLLRLECDMYIAGMRAQAMLFDAEISADEETEEKFQREAA